MTVEGFSPPTADDDPEHARPWQRRRGQFDVADEPDLRVAQPWAYDPTEADDPLAKMRVLPPKPAKPDIQGQVPDYSAEEWSEVHELLNPLVHECRSCGTWNRVPTTLDRLRTLRGDYVSWLEDRNEQAWRSQPQVIEAAERRFLQAQEAERERTAVEARREQVRQRLNAAFGELMTAGLSVEEARDRVSEQYALALKRELMAAGMPRAEAEEQAYRRRDDW